MSKKYIIHEDTLYEKKENDLFTSFQEIKLPREEPTPEWKGPKIPWSMWEELVAWCQVTQEKFKSEALALLFFDKDKGEWSHWYPPQKTQGMTVNTDEDDPHYKAERSDFPDLQFGTLHHHCTSNAFASGVDHSDEINREGLHFTIGNIGSKEHSVHYRFCIQNKCYEGNAASVIEPPKSLQGVPEKYLSKIMEEVIQEPVDASQWDFTEPLKNVKKKSYAPTHIRTYTKGIGYGKKIPLTIKNISDIKKVVLENEDETDAFLDELEQIAWAYDITPSTGFMPSSAKQVLTFYKKKSKDKETLHDQMQMEAELFELIEEIYNLSKTTVKKLRKSLVAEFLTSAHAYYKKHYE